MSTKHLECAQISITAHLAHHQILYITLLSPSSHHPHIPLMNILYFMELLNFLVDTGVYLVCMQRIGDQTV